MSEQELRLGFEGHERREKVNVPDTMPSPWDRGREFKVMGKDHTRKDAFDKVTGRARFTYDIVLDRMIYAKMLRSPHASARVTKVDLAKAAALPGVVHTKSLQGAVIRHAGQAVAGIAAESEEILDDALALIDVEYDVLDHVVTVEDSQKKDAPRVAGRGPNVRQPGRGGRRGDPDKVAADHKAADVVVEAEYSTQVQTHSCLETHGCVCRWDGDKLTVWASTQSTFAFLRTMSRSLGVPAGNIEVITEHMGGGFGSKFGASGWDIFCAEAARATKRPCRYMLDRREEHLIGGNRPSSIQKCKFSVNKDGTLMGAEVHSWGTAGNGGGAGVENPSIYTFKSTLRDSYDVLTHAGNARAFRAPRHPQGIFALEGMIDELAEAIGKDPLELRRKNVDTDLRRAQIDRGAKEIGWERRRKSGSDKGPVKRGLGMASSRWTHNARPGTVVNCRIGRDGSVLMANGSQDIGTGTRTVIAITAAEELGLTPEQVDVRLGHTSDPFGHGSGGSVTTPSITPPTRHAAWLAKRELLATVARKTGGDADKMDVRDGQVVGAKRGLSWAQACGLLDTDAIETSGQSPREFFSLPRYTRTVAGVQFAEVEVDTGTGAVRVVKVVCVQDCGHVVDTLTTRSQIHGGVIQGISYALYENRLLDLGSGDMLNANLTDYKIVGSREVPEIVAIPMSISQGQTITGVSSLGEPVTVPTAGAIGNAVANAIGVRLRSLPITPDKVLAALGGV